jgi:hypothetical protein
MPFTTPEARRMTDILGPKTLGDYCFLYYRPMVQAWKLSRRWTTAHELYRKMREETHGDKGKLLEIDEVAAYELAWQVFFNLHVMPYEIEKRTVNGEAE